MLMVISQVGADSRGDYIERVCIKEAQLAEHVPRSATHRTATYLSLLDADGSLVGAVADMGIASELADYALQRLQQASAWEVDTSYPKWLVVDGNVPVEGLEKLAAWAGSLNIALGLWKSSF